MTSANNNLEASRQQSMRSAVVAQQQQQQRQYHTFAQAFPAPATSLLPTPTPTSQQQQQQPPPPSPVIPSPNTNPNNATTTSSSSSGVLRQHKIFVSPRQRGNPVLNLITKQPWEFSNDLLADYAMGEQTCALYISLKYAKLHPKYLYSRMAPLRKRYKVRILFCHVDVDDYAHVLEEITKCAFVNEWTMMCAWSAEEVARYLEIFKSSENQSVQLLREPGLQHMDARQQFGQVLLKIKGINRTDVATLAATFGSLQRIATASMDELVRCPGIGEVKVKRIRDAFTQPFLLQAAISSSQQQQ